MPQSLLENIPKRALGEKTLWKSIKQALVIRISQTLNIPQSSVKSIITKEKEYSTVVGVAPQLLEKSEGEGKVHSSDRRSCSQDRYK